MIEYLPQALSSLGAALNIGKSFIQIRDSAKLQEAVVQFNNSIIDAQSKIISAQNQQSLMSAKIDELEKECMRLKDWETERKEYMRKEIGPGVFVYIANNYMGKFQNAHKYCCNCFDNYKKSTLQQFRTKINYIGLSCHNKCPDLIFHHYIDVT